MTEGVYRIIDVDRSNPIGKLVGEYGDEQYWKGFGIGYITGILVSFSVCFLGLWLGSKPKRALPVY